MASNSISSKLFRWLSSLNKATVNRFSKKIYADTSRHEDDRLVLEYVLKFYPLFNPKQLDKETSFYKIFGSNTTYNYSQLMKAISRLQISLLDFLKAEMLEADENDFISNYLSAKVFKKYHLQNDLKSLLKKEEKEKEKNHSIWTSLNQLQWIHLSYFSDVHSKTNQSEEPLIDADSHLDTFYIGAKLKYACELSSWNRIMGKNTKVPHLEYVMNYCKKNTDKLPIYIALYFSALQLIQTLSSEEFNKLEKLFRKRRFEVHHEDQVTILTYLINFTFRQIQQNKEDFFRKALNLYKFGISEKLLTVNEQFLSDHVVYIITLSSVLKEFQWIESFLEVHQNSLKKVVENSYFYFALARLSFAKADYEEALSYIYKLDHNDAMRSAQARYLTIACHYELDAPIAFLLDKCDAYTLFLNRKVKHIKELSEGCKNFIKVVRGLLSSNSDKEKLAKFLDKQKVIVLKHWLVEKVDQKK